jgi:uncharacterized protein with PIN domain
MSTQRHPIIPDSFVDDYNADSVAEALRKAELRPSTTPDEERKRCPNCGALGVMPKSAKMKDYDCRKEGNYKCDRCFSHFDDPA